MRRLWNINEQITVLSVVMTRDLGDLYEERWIDGVRSDLLDPLGRAG